jgi:hypothetical protein
MSLRASLRTSPIPQSDRTVPYNQNQAVSSTATPLSLPRRRCPLTYFHRRPYVKYLVLKSNSIDSTMEPIFAQSASETVTAELRAQLDAAVAARGVSGQ